MTPIFRTSQLRAVQTGFETAERTVGQLLDYVQEFVEGADGSGGALEDVHKAGARARATAEEALRGLEIDENE